MNALKIPLQILLTVLVVALGVIGADRLVAMRETPEATPPEVRPPLVEVVVASAADVRLSVPAQGTVVPRSESRVAAEVPGRVTWVSPALVNGGFFEAEDVLARTDTSDLALAVTRAQLELASAERRLAEEEADAAVAIREWEEHGEGEPTPLVRREPQLAEARAAQALAAAALAEAEGDVDRAEVKAPYAGRVRAKHVDVGSYLQPGSPIADLYAVDWAEVRLPLPDADLAHLDLRPTFRDGAEDSADAEGPPVRLHAEFAGDVHVWEGRVVRTEGELSARNRMVMLVARVEDPYGRHANDDRPPLALGMFVDADVAGRTVPGGIVLPRVALRPNDRVWVIDGTDRLRLRDVDVVQRREHDFVLAGGVEDGERVVVGPVDLPVDGMAVRVHGAGGDL